MIDQGIEIIDVKDKATGEKYLAVSGREAIVRFMRENKGVLFGKKIQYTGEKTLGGYIPDRKKYIPSYNIFVIGNNGFTEEDVILYKHNKISIYRMEDYLEKFERYFGREDIKISSKGILRMSENAYLDLNNFSVFNLNDEEKITLRSGELKVVIDREETNYFDKIKELLKNYVEE